jgi:hypothetical protein
MRSRTAVVAALLLLAACSTAYAASSADVRVAPHGGGRHAAFVVRFTAPGPSGAQGVLERTYRVSATGPARRGCRARVAVPAQAAQAGERVRVSLRPGDGSRWCRGRFRGRVTMTEGPYCDAEGPCPAKAGAVVCAADASAGACGPCTEAAVASCCPVCPPPAALRAAYACAQCGPGFATRIVELGRFRFRVR